MTLLVGATQLRCRVVAINRDEAALRPSTAPRVSRQELEGAGSLIFAHRGSLVALKGRARWGEAPTTCASPSATASRCRSSGRPRGCGSRSRRPS